MTVPLPPLNLSAPSSSESRAAVDGRQAFDASGWVVATGGARAVGGTSGGQRQSGGFSAPDQGFGSAVDVFSPDYAGASTATRAGGSPLMWLLIAGAVGFILIK